VKDKTNKNNILSGGFMLVSELISELQRGMKEHGDGEVKVVTIDDKEIDHIHGNILYACGCHWNNPRVSSFTICAQHED